MGPYKNGKSWREIDIADGLSDVSLVEFIPLEINYLDGIINKDEFVNLDFLNDINANDKLLITFE